MFSNRIVNGPHAGQLVTAFGGTDVIELTASGLPPVKHRYRLQADGSWVWEGPCPQNQNKSASSLPSFHQIKER